MRPGGKWSDAYRTNVRVESSPARSFPTLRSPTGRAIIPSCSSMLASGKNAQPCSKCYTASDFRQIRALITGQALNSSSARSRVLLRAWIDWWSCDCLYCLIALTSSSMTDFRCANVLRTPSRTIRPSIEMFFLMSPRLSLNCAQR